MLPCDKLAGLNLTTCPNRDSPNSDLQIKRKFQCGTLFLVTIGRMCTVWLHKMDKEYTKQMNAKMDFFPLEYPHRRRY